jgi:ribose transport system ATP-binding protein
MKPETTLPPEAGIILSATGITKSFPGVRALDGVSITVRRGKLNALLGENGAGKSTLMNILAGVFPPDAGDIFLGGQSVSFISPRHAQESGISIIFQELNLVPGLSIAENIFIGREPINPLGLIDYDRMNRDTQTLLADLELSADPRTLIGDLKVGEQQVVEIARAMSFNSHVIIMDEPTSAITEHEVAVLFRQIHRLKQNGTGIIYITHKLDELSQIADEITVFRDGKLIGTRGFADVTREEMIRMMVGRELSDLFPKTSQPQPEEIFSVENLSLRRSHQLDDFAVREVSLTVRRGEVLGIFGLMGAGRTELLEAIFGLHAGATSGDIKINCQRVKIHSPADAIAAGLALAPEDRKADGLVLGMTVAENTTLACLRDLQRAGFLQPQQEHTLVENYVGRLHIKTPSIHQATVNLSGGNQQKVVLAKWLATKPKVLLLDEPTRGIDVNAKKEIYGLIDELAGNGLAVVMVSSELPEILGIADRIAVLAEGRKTAEFLRGQATEEMILKAALPTGKSNHEL